MDKIKILIVEDHQIFRLGIKTLLSKQGRFDIVGEAEDGLEACQKAKKTKPDIILLDIHLPKKNGIEVAKDILSEEPNTKILILSIDKEEDSINKILKAGALGYVLKNASSAELINAIKVLAKGNSYFSKEVSSIILSQITKPRKEKFIIQSSIKLSKREMEILEFIASELTNKEIANKLFISPRTVDTHRRNLLQKLKVKNTAGLVKYYMKMKSGELAV